MFYSCRILISKKSQNTVVPYNQPVAALDMLNRFLKNETFLDLPSPTIRFGDTSVAPADFMANPTSKLLTKISADPAAKLTAKISAEPTVKLISNPIPTSEEGMGTHTVASLGFLGGIIVTLFVSKLWGIKRGAGGYRRIPDATTSDGAKH